MIRIGDEEDAVRWSVGLEAEGDRVFTREEIVELADAVAASDGIASGIATSRYGARLIVVADSREDAIAAATEVFVAAAATAGVAGAPVGPTPGITQAAETTQVR